MSWELFPVSRFSCRLFSFKWRPAQSDVLLECVQLLLTTPKHVCAVAVAVLTAFSKMLEDDKHCLLAGGRLQRLKLWVHQSFAFFRRFSDVYFGKHLFFIVLQTCLYDFRLVSGFDFSSRCFARVRMVRIRRTFEMSSFRQRRRKHWGPHITGNLLFTGHKLPRSNMWLGDALLCQLR